MNSAKRLYGKKYSITENDNQSHLAQNSFFKSKVNRKINPLPDIQIGPGHYDISLPIVKPNYQTIKKNNNTVILKVNYNISCPFNSKQPRFKQPFKSLPQQKATNQPNRYLNFKSTELNSQKIQKQTVFERYNKHLAFGSTDNQFIQSVKDNTTIENLKQLTRSLHISQINNKNNQILYSQNAKLNQNKLGSLNFSRNKSKSNLNVSNNLSMRENHNFQCRNQFNGHRNYSENYGNYHQYSQLYEQDKINQNYSYNSNQNTEATSKQLYSKNNIVIPATSRLHNQQPKIILKKRFNSSRYNSLQTKSTQWSKYKQQRKSFVQNIPTQDIPGPGSYRLKQPKFKNYKDLAQITSWQFNSKTERKAFEASQKLEKIDSLGEKDGNQASLYHSREDFMNKLPGQAEQMQMKKRILNKKRSKKSLADFYAINSSIPNQMNSLSNNNRQSDKELIIDMTKSHNKKFSNHYTDPTIHSRQNLPLFQLH